jgi:hypothetical protein
MRFTGKLAGINMDWQTGKYNVTFTINEQTALAEVEKIQECEKLSVEAVQYREKRSIDANGLLWHCLGKIASSMNPPADKWDIYLMMLKRYGSFTYICVKPKAVEAVKQQWRECEVVGDIEINGQKAVQMLCYFGSSTYDTQEFSVLLNGVISEMQEMGLETPPSQDMRRALENWEKMHEKTD